MIITIIIVGSTSSIIFILLVVVSVQLLYNLSQYQYSIGIVHFLVGDLYSLTHIWSLYSFRSLGSNRIKAIPLELLQNSSYLISL